MIKVQPNFISKSAYKPAFRAQEEYFTQDKFDEEKDFYEQQIEGFNDIIDDKYVPSGIKKAAKVLRIISEGILEGWAVAWGAKKGINFLKSSGAKAINSNFYKKSAEILNPAKEGLAKVFANFKEFAVAKLAKLGETKFGQSEFTKFIKKQYDNIKVVLKPIRDKVLEKTGKITFEKATNIAAATLGVGSGTAGAVNAALRENQANQDICEAA